MAKIIPTVDKEKCIGCGACVSVAPDIFELGSDGKSHPKVSEVKSKEKVKEAMEVCPVGAIGIKEE